jgi:hypothetical protein
MGNIMWPKLYTPAQVCLVFLALAGAGFPKQTESKKFIGWAYARTGPLEVYSKPGSRNPGLARFRRGALAPVLKLESHAGKTWARVSVLDLATLTPQPGWVESDQAELLPFERFPTDSELLRQLGGAYLDDVTASHAQIARFLVRRGSLEPALVCFISSQSLPSERLAAFIPVQGALVSGPSLEFPSTEIQAGIIAAEVRDLLGDGHECLVTREPFRAGPEDRGVKMVIRRLEDGTFKKLWDAPVEFRRLDAYPPQVRVLQPPEKNIGAPGTLTRGEVTFRPQGSLYVPVWRGNVELYVIGRDKPVESVPIEKLCAWDGTEFVPLQGP